MQDAHCSALPVMIEKDASVARKIMNSHFEDQDGGQ